jgi:hypothetical protein
MPLIWLGDHGGAGMPAQILSVASGKLRCDARPVDSGGGL